MVGGRTRVVFSTLARRGKSFTPVSRIETLEERRALLERREETQDARAFAIGLDWNLFLRTIGWKEAC